jgi:hypothetical protein
MEFSLNRSDLLEPLAKVVGVPREASNIADPVTRVVIGGSRASHALWY